MSYAYYVDKNGKVTKGSKKKKKQTEFLYTVDAKGKVTKNNIDDIAPVKSTKKKEKGGNKNSIFKSGGFSDGVDSVGDFFGDLGESIVGTVGDVGVGIGKGLARFGEGVGDAARYGIAAVADASGNDDYAKRLRKSAKEDDTSKAFKKAEKKVDKWSVLGDKADVVTEGLGYVGATILTGGIAGGLGAGAKVATAITRGVQGVSALGSGMSEAYQSGATGKEATTYGAIASAGEVISSSLFGGLGKTVNVLGMSKGLSSADDLLAKKVSSMFTNQIAKNFTQFGIKAGAEGTEEVLSGIVSAVGKKVTYMDKKELSDILKDEKLLEQFAVGAITSGIAQSGVVPGMKQGSLIEANKQGTDFITGRTESEQSLIDSLVEEQTAQKSKEKAIEDNVKKIIEEREEAQGGVLSEKNKQALRKTVMDKIDSGEIDISSSKLSNKEISAITKEIEQSLEDGTYELSKIEDVLTSEQTKQIKELEEKLKNTKDKSEISNIQNQLSELKNARLSELQSMTKNNRYLNNAIYEKQQFQKAYEYDDANVTDEYEKGTRESAKTHLNNSKESRKLVDIMSKLAKDRQINYRFTNQQELKEQGDLVENENLTTEEKTKINNLEKQLKDATTKEEKQYIQNQIDKIKYLDIGGFVRKNADGVETVIINAESSQSINNVVGHETKHLLEKNKELNEEFDKLLFDYAKSKGDYDVVRNYIEKNYEGIKNVNIDSELSAELTGRYLFTDDKFIESLINDNKNPKKQTIVQKIKELIDDLVVRFKGTEQEKQLRQVQKKFKELYNQNEDSKVSSKDDAFFDGDTKYSLSDSDGKTLTKEQQEYFKDSKVRDENGNLKVMYHGTPNGDFTVFRDGTYFTENKEYADRYQSPSASSISSGKVATNPKTYEVYLDIKKPFDISDSEARDIYINEYIKGGNAMGINPYLSDSEYAKINTIDWTEGEDLREFLIDNDYDYDGLILDEGADGGYGDEVLYRGKSYVVFSPEQIKNINNTNPTSDADIRYSLSKDTTLTEEQESLIRETNELTFTKNYGKDTYSVMGYDKNENATYIKYDATKEELSQAFGEDIANEITSYKIDLQQHKLDESFLNLPASKDTEGRKLSKEQKEYFKNIIPELKDDNGNLKVLYHGTPNEFTQFNYDFIGSNGTALGKGFYLTDSRDIASGYVGENGKIMELYANIEKPLSLTEKNITKAKYKKFVKAVDKATGGDYLSNYGEVDYEGYNNVLSRALDDYTYDDNDVDLIHSVFNVSGLGWEEGFRLLKKTLGYDGVVQHNFQGTGTTVFVPTLPEQIKSVTNQNPTDNADINLSLSRQGQELSPYGNYNVYGKDIALEQAPVQETIPENETVVDDVAPVSDTQQNSDEFEKLVQSYMNSDDVPGYLFEDDEIRAWAEEQAKKEIENPTAKLTAEKTVNGDTVDPFENRDIDEVGNRKTNAYMYENPEVKPFFQEEARVMLAELQNSVKGERGRKGSRYGLDENEIGASNEGWFGTKRETSEEIAYLLDKFKYSYKDIEKGLKAIIEDNGAENNAISKRIEFKLDERLRYGHDNFMGDDKAQPNQEYINLLNDKQVTEYSDESFNSWVGSLKEDIAPVEENVEQNLYSMEDTKNNEINELDTKVEETEKADEPELTVNESFDAKIENYKNAIKGYNTARTEIETAFDEAIEKKTKEYENLKRKNTKKATHILMQIENLKLRKANNLSNIDSRIEKTQTRIDNMIKNSETIKQGMYGKRRKALHTEIMDGIKSTFSSKGFDFDKVLENAKDKSTFASVDNTPQRFMEKTLGYKEGQALADLTVNKVAQNESAGIKWVNENVKLLKQISKEYDIKPGSKESAAAQMYAEGFYINDKGKYVKYGNKELLADFKDLVVIENIKKLAKDSRIRSIYDETLDQINKSRTRNAYPEIPKRDNYFLHFIEMDDTFSRLGIPFNPNDIRAKDLPTDINGMTVDLKPGQPYFASAMHRKGLRTTYDLLGGVEKYLNSAKNQIFHIDDIQTLRATRNYIADMFGQAHGLEDLDTMTETEAAERIEQVFGSHLSNFAKFLHEEANVIAGKTALIDRGLEGIVGRKGITFLNTLNGQVGSNMIGFNVSSSLTNFVSVMQSMAKSSKVDTLKAFTQTVSNKIDSMLGRTTDGFSDTNPAIIRRKGIEKFARKPFEKVSDSGYILMSAIDDISTELIVRTKFNELTRKGMSEEQAHIESDKWAHRILGDRSLGQQPLLYNSKMLGLVTKFQLEVRNQLDSQFYDTIQDANVSTEDIDNATYRNAVKAAKVGSTLVQLAVLQHVFGKAFESVAGYNPAFDIIEVLMTTLGYDDEEGSEDEPLDNIEQGFLALLEDMPYTSVLTGGRIPIASALPITELIKGEDSYGREKPRTETLKEMAPYYLLPTGYGQIKKTKQGLDMFSDKHPVSGSYTDSGDLRFPVEDTPKNRIQAGLFGQYANENARYYFDNDIAPLKEKQIKEYVDVDMPIKDYWEYREGLKGLESLNEKGDYIGELDIPVNKKNILINNIANRKEPIDFTGYEDYQNFEELDFYNQNPKKYKFLQENDISYEEYSSNKDTKKTYDWAYKNPKKYKFLQSIDVSYKDYNKNDDTREAYTWAFNNPDKYTLSKAASSDVVTYRKYTKDLYNIKADKDKYGKSITGSRKKKVANYINKLDADYGEKLILFKSEYNSDDTYNREIVDYLNNREDITFDEMNTILKELGFTVTADGTIYWN